MIHCGIFHQDVVFARCTTKSAETRFYRNCRMRLTPWPIAIAAWRFAKTPYNLPMPESKPLVAVIMGSKSDWETMRHAVETLDELGVPNEAHVLSAHRTPDATAEFARNAAARGLRVVIAGAGGAAHLAGVIAAHTLLPVLGVPIQSKLQGLDSLLSTAQMPGGIPVGTLAIGEAGAKNAALLAAAILAGSDDAIRQKLEAFRKKQSEAVLSAKLPR
jgi:5-(carboxyamino)imidazole ribonucleotide mutase